MKNISLLIKPMTSICNLNCKYCFYKELKPCTNQLHQHKMSFKTATKIIENVAKSLEPGDSVRFDFQGGEPALMGLRFYEDFIKKVEEIIDSRINVSYSFQTNGLLLTEKYMEFFKRHEFLIGLSIDGPEFIHDMYRIDHQGNGTFKGVMKAKKLLDKYQIDYNVLMVITEFSAKYPEEIWQFILDNDIKYLQFINCMSFSLNHEEISFKPGDYNKFYSRMFRKWNDSLKEGNYVSINIFDQWIRSIMGEKNLSCSFLGKCMSQYVVETNGEVYPCDFFVDEENLCGNLTKQTLKEIYESETMQEFLNKGQDHLEICNTCPYLKICNGGCKKLRATFIDKSGIYCGYREFLHTNIKKAQLIAKALI